MRQIFLDTETTGLSPESGDRIVELGCIEMVNRRLTGRHLHRYINPQRHNSEEALRVHGLTDEFLSGQPVFDTIASEFVEFVRGAEVIIHNAGFDVGFLDAELRRVRQPAFDQLVAKVTDSLLMAREQYPGKANSLDALCRRLEVDNTNRTLHGALLDAGLLAEVYIRMTRGQNTLVIDADSATDSAAAAGPIERVDLAAFDLPVVHASADELAFHDRLLDDLDKASGGKTLWRKLAALP